MDPSCTSGDSSLTPLEALDLPQDPSKQKEQSWTTVTSKSWNLPQFALLLLLLL